jgi:hypothetical protein
MHRNPVLAVSLLAIVAGSAAFAAADRPEGAVTFSKQVAPILQENCQTCHRPGDIAPMSLLTYDEARPWAKSIRQVVSDRTMPPWHADAQPGTFSNDSSLSEQEIATLVAWVDQDAPEGDPADLPPAKTFAVNGWKTGTPDLVYWIPETYNLPATVDDEYRCFVIPDKVDQDIWYSGLEVKPGNPAVVHHVIVFADPGDSARQRDAADPSPGFLCGMASGGIEMKMVGGWAPGRNAGLTRSGSAMKIAAGTTLVYQVHYHNTTGAEQPDRSGMALYLTRETVHQQPRSAPIGAWDLNIAAGDANSEHSAAWTAPADIHVRAIMPHMHYIGKDMKLTAVLPGGDERVLLDVPRYDFNWQANYVFAEPVALPKGTVIKMVSHHDNSAANPRNQFSPPRDIHFGEATHEEMSIAFTSFVVDDEDLKLEPVLPREMITANQAKEAARLAAAAGSPEAPATSGSGR